MKTTTNAKTRAALKAARLALAAAALAGCEPCGGPSPSARPESESGSFHSEFAGATPGGRSFSVVEVKGHEYVVASGVRCVSMVHAESCPCRGGAAK